MHAHANCRRVSVSSTQDSLQAALCLRLQLLPILCRVYCNSCEAQAQRNETGKPTYGCVEDRAAVGLMEYKEPKTRKPSLPFANVMNKLGVTREEVEDEAARLGISIPEVPPGHPRIDGEG